VFGETLVFGRLLDATTDYKQRLSLLADRIDGSIATVFRQMAMNRFEHLVHTGRRSEGELSADRLVSCGCRRRPSCSATRWRSPRLPDVVVLHPSLHQHPGYVYAYAYGQLLALSAYSRYRQEGDAFVPRYLELLAAGGSLPPDELAESSVSISMIRDSGTPGLTLIDEQLREAEQLAERRRSSG